ncbi:susC [Symbiodinium microadriaticum]|nr:susC [Symbiodinium microadriaticum]
MFLGSFNLWGQNIISGNVSDANGEPLIGVTVLNQEANTGSITDIEGNFRVSANTGETLVFSMVGMESREVLIQGQTTLTITLNEEAEFLGEVVVTGFQEVNRKLFTGAAENVNMEDIAANGMPDVSRVLEGQVAGVNVDNVSGTFGTSPKIRIRGNTSINGNNQPLFVVDGVILEDLANVNTEDFISGNANTLIGSSVANLNPSDIASFQILKDASATAIYGARAANGVIVITTKRGRSGALRVNYSGNFSGKLRPTYAQFDLLNSAEEMEVYRELFDKGLIDIGTSVRAQNYGAMGKMFALIANHDLDWGPGGGLNEEFLNQYENANTDWFDLLFNDFGLQQQHSLSFTAGNEKNNSYYSVSYLNDQGQTIADNVQRITATARNTYFISDKFSFGLKTTASYRDQLVPGTRNREFDPITGQFSRSFDINPLSYSLNTARSMRAFDENGNREYFRRNFTPFNILDELEYNFIDINVADVSAQTDFEVTPYENLQFKGVFQARYASTKREHTVNENSNQAEAYRANQTQFIQDANNLLYTDPNNPGLNPVVVLPQGGFSYLDQTDLLNVFSRVSGEWSKNINTVHDINVLAGQEIRFTNRAETSATGIGVIHESGGIVITDPKIIEFFNSQNIDYYNLREFKDRFIGWFFNGGYAYQSKYIANFTVRYDGSNQLGRTQRARYLPTWNVSGAWNVSNESFMDFSFLDELKIRSTYGVSGNLPPQASAILNLQADVTVGNFADMASDGYEISLFTNNYEAQNFTWSTSFNLGYTIDRITKLDFGPRLADAIGQGGAAVLGGPRRGLYSVRFAGLNSNGVPTFESPEGETVFQFDLQIDHLFTVVRIMRLKRPYLNILVVVMAMTITACDSFLDEVPDNRVDLNNLDKAAQVLTNAYAVASTGFTDWMTDDVDVTTGTTKRPEHDVFFWEDIEQGPSYQDTPEFFWYETYNAIAHANEVLNVLDELPAETTEELRKKDAIEAEARLARAYGHFMLVSLFGKPFNLQTSGSDPGVPYITEPEVNFIQLYERNSVRNVYERIEEDLLIGLEKVDDTFYANSGKYHFNRNAALAFASRYYLFRGDFLRCIEYSTRLLGNDPGSFVRDMTSETYQAAKSSTSGYPALFTSVEEPANLMLIRKISLIQIPNLGCYEKEELNVPVNDPELNQSELDIYIQDFAEIVAFYLFDSDFQEKFMTLEADLVSELTAPPNGWKLDYQPNSSSGSFLILLDFDDRGNLQIRSDVIAENGEYLESNITYRIDAALNLELIFESYAVFHYLFDLGDGALGGEFQFIYDRKQGDNLIFRAKSEGVFAPEIVFEPASGNESELFSTELFQQIDLFQGDAPTTIGEYIFGQPNIESPRQKLTLQERNISVFWSIDITGRFLSAEVAAVGITDEEIFANDEFVVIDQFTGFTFQGGNLEFNEPITFSLNDQSISISSLTIGDFNEAGPELCPGSGNGTPQFAANSQELGSALLQKSLVSSDAEGFVEDGVYLINAFFMFDADGNSLQEEGVIFNNLPDAGAFAFFYEFENDTLPDNMMGFITLDSLGNSKWIFNEINPTKQLNKISFEFTDDYYTLGDVSAQEISGLRVILDELFSGNDQFIYDFDYIDGLTLYWFYNPCNQYEFLLLEN